MTKNSTIGDRPQLYYFSMCVRATCLGIGGKGCKPWCGLGLSRQGFRLAFGGCRPHRRPYRPLNNGNRKTLELQLQPQRFVVVGFYSRGNEPDSILLQMTEWSSGFCVWFSGKECDDR